jgi:hypothetical protein
MTVVSIHIMNPITFAHLTQHPADILEEFVICAICDYVTTPIHTRTSSGKDTRHLPRRHMPPRRASSQGSGVRPEGRGFPSDYHETPQNF